MLLRRVTLLLIAAVGLTACGAASSSAPDTVPTVPVGDLPAPVGDTRPPATDGADTTVRRTTTTLEPSKTVGAVATGNRVILLGDSVLASTSRRYSNDMCDALVPLGWRVEVEAETSRPVQFGNQVLDDRLSAGWDVGVILLGNNYGGDQESYRTQLERLVTRLSPRQVVLLTVTEFTPSREEVNAVIREMADKYANVHLVDWAQATADEPRFVGADGLHLTTAGREALATNVAFALGQAPEQPGKCLPSVFTDDSAGPVTGTTLKPGTATTSTAKGSSGTSTTSTVKGSGDTTTTKPGSSTSGPATTTASTPATTPATTAAPTTSSGGAASGGPVPPADTVAPAPPAAP